jgi:hypothetical protein
MDYRITYEYGIHTGKEIVVKNCMGELHAKVKLNDYLKRKYGDGVLIVLTCSNNNAFNIFGDIFKGFV